MAMPPRPVLAALFAAATVTAGCGDRNARYLIETPAPAAEVRLRVATIEVREAVLPAYAAASEILAEAPDGALRPIRRAVWADDPVPGITAALARRLDERTTATAAPEPWPLPVPAAMRVDLRLDRLVARAGGTFEMAGQFALSSDQGAGRIERFDIRVPLAGSGAAAIAAAAGAALDDLAGRIIARLR